MTKKIFAVTLFIASVCFFPTQSRAEDESSTSLGLSTYAINVSYDYAWTDDEFSGVGIFLTQALSRNVALRGGFFSTEHDDWSDLEASGIDLQLLVGNDFISEGFKIYGGLGYFDEEWEVSILQADFSGPEATLGIGFNWEKAALDFWFSIRDASDYEDFIGEEASAASSALMLSYRF